MSSEPDSRTNCANSKPLARRRAIGIAHRPADAEVGDDHDRSAEPFHGPWRPLLANTGTCTTRWTTSKARDVEPVVAKDFVETLHQPLGVDPERIEAGA